MYADIAWLFSQAASYGGVTTLNHWTNHYNYSWDHVSHSEIIIPIFSGSFDGKRAASWVCLTWLPWQPFHIICASHVHVQRHYQMGEIYWDHSHQQTCHLLFLLYVKYYLGGEWLFEYTHLCWRNNSTEEHVSLHSAPSSEFWAK